MSSAIEQYESRFVCERCGYIYQGTLPPRCPNDASPLLETGWYQGTFKRGSGEKKEHSYMPTVTGPTIGELNALSRILKKAKHRNVADSMLKGFMFAVWPEWYEKNKWECYQELKASTEGGSEQHNGTI